MCSVFVQPVNIYRTDGPTQQVNAGRVARSLCQRTPTKKLNNYPFPMTEQTCKWAGDEAEGYIMMTYRAA